MRRSTEASLFQKLMCVFMGFMMVFETTLPGSLSFATETQGAATTEVAQVLDEDALEEGETEEDATADDAVGASQQGESEVVIEDEDVPAAAAGEAATPAAADPATAAAPAPASATSDNATPASPADESAFPKQSFSGKANGIQVSVEAPAGALPAGTTMTVRKSAVDGRLNQIDAAVRGLVAEARLVDITFLDADGTEIEPRAEVSVTLSVPGYDEEQNYGVIHITDAGAVQLVMNEQEVTGPEATFEAAEFSEYGVVVLTQFSVVADAPSFPVGGSTTVEAVILPDTLEDKSVNWHIITIDDPEGVYKPTTAEGATVSEDGTVTATGTGVIVVRGTLAADPTYSDIVEI